jgi:hypothetical protein
MLTALPVTGVDAVAVAETLAGAPGIDGMPLMPGMPGVVPPDPKVTDGEVDDGGDAHPDSSIAASSTIRAP